MSNFSTGAEATFSLAAAAPATFNDTGYAALTFTQVGKLENIGDIPTRVYELVRLQLLESRVTAKQKGSYDLGSQTIRFAIDPDDAGQALVRTAVNSDDSYSIKMNHPELGTIYARALIMGAPATWGSTNDPSMVSLTLEYTPATDTDDGIVAVPVT
ncbi:MAG: hypothetical protein AAFR88_04945 [Pseudomonadota bacterium]